MSNPNKQSWIIRKGLYFIFGAVLAVAAIFGWITTEQADEWLEIAARTVESVAAAALIFAGTKTHRGSDDNTTVDDVKEAAKTPATQLIELRDTLETLYDKITNPTPTVAAPKSTQGGTYPKGQ